ncbi:hypothetical protein [Aeromicrobium endophyticum]|uniref:J domain-containing protein n=1 Tax=Aeromicrobium endophyticum TaxID=2292704 RepID=A0A371PCB8_9ACTN|nr:hypothetical protein [Aeromicrobium endophyticum]REK73591.1 hypothetical protein DX116_08630 [Aeromicrobium endophyticum]
MTTPRQAPEGLDALRAARREAVKRHHPDRGGSSDDLREALDHVEHEHRAARHVTPIPPPIHPEVPATFRAATTPNGVLITAIRRLQRHLPRRVPGSRRYIRL